MTSKITYSSTASDKTSKKKSTNGTVFNLVDKNDPYRLLKLGIWAYFFLLIFEGALRKWFLPGLSGPLLLIRDPLALWLVILCWKKGLLPKTSYLSIMVLIGILGIFTAMLFGHGSLPVAIYGARILLIHFPFMFVIGRIFNHNDVVKLGKLTLCMAIPVAVLIALQFYSPQSAWVNRGVGGDMNGSGFSGALGYFRPSGTFSFTNGNTLFFSFVACLIIYFWISAQNINKIILLGATTALVVAIPLSISRSLFFQVGVSLIFTMVAISRKPKYFGRMLVALAGGFLAIAILSNASFFQTATEVFNHRFESANKAEGGVEGVFLDRYLGGLLRSVSGPSELPFFGYGLGMGTNVGSVLLSGGRTFLIAEGEWGRLIGELGLLMGLAVILIRLGICLKLVQACYQRITHGDLLPWILLSFGLLLVAQAQWAQPTALGFSTFVGGLMIASLKSPLTRRLHI